MASTQDVARNHLDELPFLVLASGQTEGRGRSGSEWLTADRALAASLAFRHRTDDTRPISLMAGLAAVRATNGASLKWPNDVLVDGSKVGGILVERSDGVTVAGLGLNLWWPTAPEGMGALLEDDPGPEEHAQVGSLWGAELMELLQGESWAIDDYRRSCVTLGQEITWDPGGWGRAVDVDDDGALVVETESGRVTLHSGAVRHVRWGRD